jgi:hypothetical protein
MAEAYGPLAEGPEAIYWNPAGLAQMRRAEASYTRSEFLDFFHHDFLAYAYPSAWAKGTIAASLTRFSQDSLPVVTNGGQELGNFSPHSEAVAIAYAHSFDLEEGDLPFRDYFKESWSLPGNMRPLQHDKEPWSGTVMAGLSLKFINETIYQRSATAFAVDGGALFRPVDLRELRMSFAVRNLGSREKFINDSQSLPLEMDFGAAWDQQWWKSRLVPALEIALPYYGNPYAKLGVEYSNPVTEDATVAVRAGYKSLTATNLSPLTGITFGLGTVYKRLKVDFGFQPMAELGQTYRFSVAMTW